MGTPWLENELTVATYNWLPFTKSLSMVVGRLDDSRNHNKFLKPFFSHADSFLTEYKLNLRKTFHTLIPVLIQID